MPDADDSKVTGVENRYQISDIQGMTHVKIWGGMGKISEWLLHVRPVTQPHFVMKQRVWNIKHNYYTPPWLVRRQWRSRTFGRLVRWSNLPPYCLRFWKVEPRTQTKTQ